MIITNILGGLGNQMFQYAIGKSLALTHGQNLKVDISAFDDYMLRNYELEQFIIEVDIASKKEIEMLKYTPSIIHRLATFFLKRDIKKCSNSCYREKNFHFDANVLGQQKDVYLFGYWQSEKYFLEHRTLLLKEFSPKNKLSVETLTYEKKIKSTTSVSLHIRRGDYVNNSTTNSYHGLCSLDYYREAVSLIQQDSKDTSFFVFSDDLQWAKENLTFVSKAIFVELPKEVPDSEEMYLMSQCKHNIIANSSFSWWGAWLNQNQKKRVIAPFQWFTDNAIDTSDLIPNDWTRI